MSLPTATWAKNGEVMLLKSPVSSFFFKGENTIFSCIFFFEDI